MADTIHPADEPVRQPEGADIGEGGVRRQSGPDLPTIHRSDPLAHAPVVQVDPEVKVTRQAGIFVQDAGAGVVRMDSPLLDDQEQSVLLTDRRVKADEDQVVPGVRPEVAGSLHAYGPVNQVGEVEVARVGDDPEFMPPSGVHHADQPLPADHPTGVVSQDLPDVVLPKEQLEQFRQDKPYKTDRPMSEEEVAQQQAQLAEALGVPKESLVSGDTSEVQLKEKVVSADEAEGEQSKTARQKEDTKGTRKKAVVTEEE